jgi:hypothetical protein
VKVWQFGLLAALFWFAVPRYRFRLLALLIVVAAIGIG